LTLPTDFRRRGTKKKRIGPRLMSSDRIHYKQLNPKASLSLQGQKGEMFMIFMEIRKDFWD
jgi:hypothetical protein